MSAQLQLVAPAVESPAKRAQRLLAEAREAAEEQVFALETALNTVSELAAEVAAGGDAYPAGVRELARRLAEEIGGRIQTLDAIMIHAVKARR
jgi:hypothetical protein